MAHVKFDMVQETSTTAGTGVMTLAGAVLRRRTFGSVMANADTCHYTIEHTTANEWEVGVGTYTTVGTTLTRTTVLSSSNAGALVNFSAGSKNIHMGAPANASVVQDNLGDASVTGDLRVSTANTVETAGTGGLVRWYVSGGIINGLGTSSGALDIRSAGIVNIYAGSTPTRTFTIGSTGIMQLPLTTSAIGIGGAPTAALHVRGVGQSSGSVDTATTLGAALFAQDNQSGVVGAGGMIMFGSSGGAFSAIKGHVISNTPNTTGDLVISTRRANADATLTETARFLAAGSMTLASSFTNSGNIVTDGGYVMVGRSGDAAGTSASMYLDTGTPTAAPEGTAAYALIYFRSGASNRWYIGKGNAAETGTPVDSGSDFVLYSYTDAGAAKGTAVFVERDTRNFGINTTAPTNQLYVAVSSVPSAPARGITIHNTATSSAWVPGEVGGALDFSEADTSGWVGTRHRIGLGFTSATGGSSNLYFQNSDVTGVMYTAMQVNSEGSVYLPWSLASTTGTNAKFYISGNASRGAWAGGVNFLIASNTITDTTSLAAATIASRYACQIGNPTFASTNAITVTTAVNFFIGTAPVAGTNTVITNSYALYTNGGSYFAGNLTLAAAALVDWDARGTLGSTANGIFLLANDTSTTGVRLDVTTDNTLKALGRTTGDASITAATAAAGTNTTQVATTAFVTAAGSVSTPPGTVVDFGGFVAPTGWLLCDGTAVSRTTYAGLLAAITAVSPAVTVTIATPAVFTWASNPLANGDLVSLETTGALPTGFVVGTSYYVVARATGTFQLAATLGGAAKASSGTQSGVHTVRRNPWGCGNGTTTFNVPDLRGRVVAMRDTATNRLRDTYFGGDSDVLGSAGGADAVSYNTNITGLFVRTGGWAGNGSDYAYTASGYTSGAQYFSTASDDANHFLYGIATDGGSWAADNHTHAVYGWTQGQSLTATINSYGAHGVTDAANRATDLGSNVQPTVIMNKIIKF